MVYARSGEDSLASIYLADPRDADGWGARSEVLRRTGDTAAAATAERQMADASDVVPGLADADADYLLATTDELADADGPEDFLTGWQGITLLVIAGLLILVIATLFARRPPKADEDDDKRLKDRMEPTEHEESSHHPVSPFPVQRRPPPEVDIEISTPPPDPDEAERIISEEIPKLRGSSMEEIFSPSHDPGSAESHFADSEEIANKQESLPTVPHARTSSRQADALRKKVRVESDRIADESIESTAPGNEVEEGESSRESMIDRARELNVSRDYVELQNRIRRARSRKS
jgi:hypothetical protein